MSLTAVLILIFIGIILILLESLVIPGTNVAGIIGIAMIVGAIFLAYRDLGRMTGHLVLAGSLVFMVLAIFLALRSNTWKRMALKTNIDGKVNQIEENAVKPGDVGVTITRMNPMGKVLVNNQQYEAKSGHSFIDPNTPVEVVKINGNQLIVKPKEV